MLDRLAELEGRYEELARQMASPEAAANPASLATLGRELSRLEPVVTTVRALRDVRAEAEATAAMLHDPDEELRAMAHEELERLAARQAELEDELRRLLVPRDPNDERGVILEVRAGTGGEEASLFAADLYRMYARYAERRHWKVDLMAVSESESGGYKEAIAEISGSGAYSRLKFESGVHRVQRVPVTESAGRIHTSTATVAVLPEAEEVEVEIPDKDLRIDVKRSSGPGGQSVNTTDSRRAHHAPADRAGRGHPGREIAAQEQGQGDGRAPCPAARDGAGSARLRSAASSAVPRSAAGSAQRRSGPTTSPTTGSPITASG